jgi:hypothetical protein
MDSEDIVRKLYQKRGRIRDPGSGIGKKFIPDPDPGSGSRIQGVKKHRISDPGSGSATLRSVYSIAERTQNAVYIVICLCVLLQSYCNGILGTCTCLY